MKKIISNIISYLKSLSNKRKGLICLLIVFLIWFWFSIPANFLNAPTSFVIEDEKGALLSARIAADGQWRFPGNKNSPEKFIACITTFEDQRFYYHPGIDPIALGRAVWQNLGSRKVVSGGSTITMQVVRLSQKNTRTFWHKLKESLLALRLECRYSKITIMSMYAANAPFGSNVVGLDAASWRYYGRSSDNLSWGEMATLAVLPNAPTLIHPGRNRNLLLNKRNRLIDKLIEKKILDQETGNLAKMEPLPEKPLPLPDLAPHLLDRYKKEYALARKKNSGLSTRISSTINFELQKNVNALIKSHHSELRANGINNAAAMVLDVETGKVLAYIGNVYKVSDPELESHVDVLAAPRSPGSTLKPLLYAALQNEGTILPGQLIPDIPIQVGGYTPKNFNLEYDGAVPAQTALSRSLNIPAVKMLQGYKQQRFYDFLKNCGFSTIKNPAEHYGLSLILGGCEVSPWELAGVYSSLARTYVGQQKNKGKMRNGDWHMPSYFSGQVKNQTEKNPYSSLDYTSLWLTFNAMQEVMRPGQEGLWNLFNSAQKIAWKTGTSFGFRDAWAIGFTPKYCVVVWVGNTDGEGRPELTGIRYAAPILFDIFRLLPTTPWFESPGFDFSFIPVCKKSGYKAGPDCEGSDTIMISKNGGAGIPCPYHRTIHLDLTGNSRVSDQCVSPSAMLHKPWFILPPTMEYYYKQKHQDYLPLPGFAPGCIAESIKQLDIIYPEANASIYIPYEMSGEKGRAIFKASHRNSNAKLYWHLDDEYVGTTVRFHHMAIIPQPGSHQLTIVDEQGEKITRIFKILAKERLQ